MSATLSPRSYDQATMTHQDSIRWALSLLKEYAEKLDSANERSCDTLEKLFGVGGNSKDVPMIEAERLISLFESTNPIIEDVVRQASGLLEQSPMIFELELELKLRLEEIEHHLRYSSILKEKLMESTKQPKLTIGLRRGIAKAK